MRIDLNCDLGEGVGNDEAVMPYITSANIACGFHAGNVDSMKRCVDLALNNGVQIGAHPGYNDAKNFGRLPHDLSDREYDELIIEQLFILKDIVDNAGGKLKHVKPHGALYNQSAVSVKIASAIAKAVNKVDSTLMLYGLANSHSLNVAKDLGLKAISEVFADRAYSETGSLCPRTHPEAVIYDVNTCKERVLKMVREGKINTISGSCINVVCETVCIHGDTPNAIQLAKGLNSYLQVNNVQLLAPSICL